MPQRLRLVVVEDDPGHALLLERTLRRAGLRNEIVIFEDGDEALRHLVEEGAEDVLLLLDLRLPRVDGFEVLRRRQSDPLLADVPVILLTTTEDPEDLETCRLLGCQHYLVKPIEFGRFAETVRRLGLAPFVDLQGESEPSNPLSP